MLIPLNKQNLEIEHSSIMNHLVRDRKSQMRNILRSGDDLSAINRMPVEPDMTELYDQVRYSLCDGEASTRPHVTCAARTIHCRAEQMTLGQWFNRAPRVKFEGVSQSDRLIFISLFTTTMCRKIGRSIPPESSDVQGQLLEVRYRASLRALQSVHTP
jgi:hypothetical protein